MTRVAFAAAACLTLFAAELRGQDITIVNHSFELPATGPGTFLTAAPPTGWIGFGSLNFNNRTVGVLNPNGTTLYSGGAPLGSNVGVVFLLDNAGNQAQFANSPAGMEQTLAVTLQSSTTYTLRVEVGNIANDANFPHSQFQFGGFPGYRIELLAGGSVIAADNNSLLPSEGGWLTSTLQFTSASSVTPGQLLGIRLLNLNSNVGLEVNFDNIRLSFAPVPEPGVMAMLACAAAAGMIARRRRSVASNRAIVACSSRQA
jgi:hypothetical protein